MTRWDVVAEYFIDSNSSESKRDGDSLVIPHGPSTTPPQFDIVRLTYWFKVKCLLNSCHEQSIVQRVKIKQVVVFPLKGQIIQRKRWIHLQVHYNKYVLSTYYMFLRHHTRIYTRELKITWLLAMLLWSQG